MTRLTSWPFAKATPKTADEPATNGTPPTDRTSAAISQMRFWKSAKMTDRQFAFWNARAKILHFFGVHSWVPSERWMLEEGLIEIVGYVCWVCPATKERWRE